MAAPAMFDISTDEGCPEVQTWLSDLGLGRYFGLLQAEGFDDFRIIRNATEEDVAELVALCAMPRLHERQFRRALTDLGEDNKKAEPKAVSDTKAQKAGALSRCALEEESFVAPGTPKSPKLARTASICSEPPMPVTGSTWQVIGGRCAGGVLVRTGQDLKSPEAQLRLGFRAKVRELDLVGTRLHFELVDGFGPATGWVSIKFSGKDLLFRCGEPEVSGNERSVYDPAEAEDLPELMAQEEEEEEEDDVEEDKPTEVPSRASSATEDAALQARRDAEEAKEREAKAAKEREAREREAKEREAKEREAKEREAREREAREREAREREAAEREAAEKEARQREAKEHEAREEARKREDAEREARQVERKDTHASRSGRLSGLARTSQAPRSAAKEAEERHSRGSVRGSVVQDPPARLGRRSEVGRRSPFRLSTQASNGVHQPLVKAPERKPLDRKWLEDSESEDLHFSRESSVSSERERPAPAPPAPAPAAAQVAPAARRSRTGSPFRSALLRQRRSDATDLKPSGYPAQPAQPDLYFSAGEPPHATEAPDEALNLLKALQRQQEEQLMAAEKASLSSGQPRSSFRERTPGGGVSRFLRSGSRSHSEAREAKQSPGFVARPPQAVPARRLYRVTTRGLGIRAGPSVDGPRTGALLRRGDIFEASVVAPGVDGRIYLKLAGWRGWAFDDSAVDPEDPSVEALSEQEAAAVLASAGLSGPKGSGSRWSTPERNARRAAGPAQAAAWELVPSEPAQDVKFGRDSFPGDCWSTPSAPDTDALAPHFAHAYEPRDSGKAVAPSCSDEFRQAMGWRVNRRRN
mmetsp:Transcript_47850/g.114028  ORF Transcript_47850/g.114028 Transcript_47850/m.114028 type:complete len:815 (-) Transcript_47850:127-2571(-)